jgi:HSP20 family protein
MRKNCFQNGKEDIIMIAERFFDGPAARWPNPWIQLAQMRQDMARLSSALFGAPPSRILSSGVFPAVNILEDKDNYYVRAELPGIGNQDIDIQVTGRNLAITGERKIDAQDEGVKYHRRERDAGKFSRIIGLPADIDPDRVDARMVNGMLTITIAKSAAAKPKQIAVN